MLIMKARNDRAMPTRTILRKSSILSRSKAHNSPLSLSQIRVFRKKVYDYYDDQGRDLPWRKRATPYRVLVSEIMLQQTQVERVIEKYKMFLAAFPDFRVLAHAPTAGFLRSGPAWDTTGGHSPFVLLPKQ